jgi:hypothetical protein
MSRDPVEYILSAGSVEEIELGWSIDPKYKPRSEARKAQDFVKIVSETGAVGYKPRAEANRLVERGDAPAKKAKATKAVAKPRKPPAPQPIAQQPATAGASALADPTEAEVYDKTKQVWLRLQRRTLAIGGTVTVPELIDELQKEIPGLEPAT